MSKIQDILYEITSFLESRDQSNSVRFRALAEEYATVCSDVEQELEKCRKMLESGLALQALQTNNRFSPSLTERARMLMFPGHTKWVGLCVLYNAQRPVLFDMELIEKLESGELSKTVESTADLQKQWREIARTGTIHEKIVLLRKLVKADKTSSVWLRNLATMEQSWLLELQNQARKAQELRDLPHLYALYMAMISPELQKTASQTILAPFQDDIHAYQQELMKKKQETCLDKIGSAYDEKNPDKLQTALAEWNDLTKDPLFSGRTETTGRIVEEAKTFLSSLLSQRDARKRSAELQNQLRMQLDEKMDLLQIEKTYHELEELGPAEIDHLLVKRYEAFVEECRTEERRRHVRTLTRWLIFSVFMAAGIIFSVLKVQDYLKISTICSEMEALIEQDAPEKVLEYFDDLSKNDPQTVSREAVLAIKEKAAGIIENRKKDQNAYDELLKKTEEYLQEDRIEQEESVAYFEQIEGFSGYHSKDQENQFMELKTRRTELLRLNQEKRDKKFQDEFKKFHAEAFELDTQLEKRDTVKINEVEASRFKLKSGISAYLQSVDPARISKDVHENEVRLLDEYLKKLEDKMKSTEHYQLVVKQLTAPASLKEYRDGLRDAPQAAPQLFAEFRTAEEQVSAVSKRQEAAAAKDAPFASDIYRKVYNAVSVSRDPYCRDIKFIMSDPDIFTAVRKDVENWKKELPDWKLYEMILPVEGGNLYLYLKSPGDFVLERAGRGGIGGAYRSVTIKIQLPQQKTETLVFMIDPGREKETYDWRLKKSISGIPEKIQGVTRNQMNDLSKGKISLAPHYSMLQATLKKLAEAKTNDELYQTFRNEIIEYVKCGNMNNAAKTAIIDRLLLMAAKLSDFHRVCVDKIRKTAGSSSLHTSWMMPDVFSREANILKKMDGFFESPGFESIRKTADLTYRIFSSAYSWKPLPAGVLYVKTDKIVCHFFKDRIQSEEYFVCLPENHNMRYFVLPEPLTGQGEMPAAELPPVLTQIRNGDLFYASPSRQPLHKQIPPGYSSVPELLQIPASLPAESKETKEK